MDICPGFKSTSGEIEQQGASISHLATACPNKAHVEQFRHNHRIFAQGQPKSRVLTHGETQEAYFLEPVAHVCKGKHDFIRQSSRYGPQSHL